MVASHLIRTAAVHSAAQYSGEEISHCYDEEGRFVLFDFPLNKEMGLKIMVHVWI